MNRKLFIYGSTQTRHISDFFEYMGIQNVDYNKLDRSTKCFLLNKLRLLFYLMRSDIVYCVGGHTKYSKFEFCAKLFGKKIVYHWIGTDVLNVKKDIYSGIRFHKPDYSLAGSNLLVKELNEIGLNAKWVPIVPYKMISGFSSVKMTSRIKHAVLVYLPESRPDFYGADYIRKLAISEPKLPFHIVANRGIRGLDFPNIIYHGYLNDNEMRELYQKITILFRFPEHDGLSMMVIEALNYGKNVIYKYNHPYVNTPKSEDIEDVYRELKNIIRSPFNFNTQGRSFVQHFYSYDNIMKLYDESGILRK